MYHTVKLRRLVSGRNLERALIDAAWNHNFVVTLERDEEIDSTTIKLKKGLRTAAVIYGIRESWGIKNNSFSIEPRFFFRKKIQKYLETVSLYLYSYN